MKRIIPFAALLFSLSGCFNNNELPGEREEETDGMERRMHQEFLMTRDPLLNTIPRERLYEFINSGSLTARTARTNALTWAQRGPSNIGGRTRAMIIDRADATGNTVLSASVSGGIFKSTNFLATTPTWTPINDFLPNLAVTAMIQDINNPLIMYAGTGEGWFNVDAVRGAGIFKSIDGGTTWTSLPSASGFEFVQDMAQDNNGNIYASLRNQTTANRGVMRSTDAGLTWTQVLGAPLAGFATGRAADLEVASNGDVYATLGVFSRTMVMKSTFATFGANTGAVGNWTEITPAHTAITQRGELAVAPSNPQRLYLMMQDSATNQVLSFYRSSNAGNTWDSLGAPPGVNNGGASQTWYNLIMAVDPTNPDVVITGGLNLARSTDGGTSWTPISTSGTVHVDHHVLIFTSSTRLINGNDGGLYYTESPAATPPTYANKNNSYNITQFYATDYHPTDQNYFLAGAQDNNTQKFTSPGINATIPVVGGDGGFCHIDQTDGMIQIAATTGNNYYRSMNGGASFSYLPSPISNSRGQFINPTDYDDNANVLYTGDNAGAYYCITGLDQITPTGSIRNIAEISTREVTAVKVDPFTANTVWLGASLGGQVPMILKISSANTSSPVVQVASLIGVPANAYVSSVDVDPVNGNHILATISNYGVPSVWESTDGGNNWNNIEGNLPDMPVRWGMFAPPGAQLGGVGTGGILLATELGVWTTSAIAGTGTVWVANNNGLANVRTDMLKYRPSDFLVAAATHGRGLYTTNLTGVTTGVNPVAITKDFIKYISSETPHQVLIVRGGLQTRRMNVQLYDSKGSLVYNKQHNYETLTINTSTLPGGSYVLRIKGDKGENFVQQFIKK